LAEAVPLGGRFPGIERGLDGQSALFDANLGPDYAIEVD